MARVWVLALLCLTSVAALPKEQIFNKISSKFGYNYVVDENGKARLTESSKTIDVEDLPIYVPARDNTFHLFTRENPTISQPLVIDFPDLLIHTHFTPTRRTVFIFHGYQGSATSTINTVLIPAYLASVNVNIILVDWSRGANSGVALSAIYSLMAARHIADFCTWLSQASGQDTINFTLVGVGLAGLMVGNIGRHLEGQVGYIAALDPSMGPRFHELLPQFRPTDGGYTEVVHTNVGNLGYIKPMGQVDFYPNGGIIMPGCGRSDECDRDRAIFYWAEAVSSGGFTGTQCVDWEQALEQECTGPATLHMGGFAPKPGRTGIYSFATNAAPPFSLG